LICCFFQQRQATLKHFSHHFGYISLLLASDSPDTLIE